MDTNDIRMTRELHVIRAHLLHYDSLLVDFRKSVDFVLETRNPVLEASIDEQREREILEREGENLLSEIKRLRTTASSQDMRLRNVIDLVCRPFLSVVNVSQRPLHQVFSLVNLEDSNHTRELTEASRRDSEATKQLSYLTMVFLPSIFIAVSANPTLKSHFSP
jgi:hypothetical protein